ncbi:MAG: peptidylprolyl isomerase [Clostridia bacterium]|nr:peptidylprolyl isomerase [Clostridia bacterium]
MKKAFALFALAAVAFSLFACAETTFPFPGDKKTGSSVIETETGKYDIGDKTYITTETTTNTVLIETSAGDIIIELYPDIAPITVENFKNLVASGYYNGSIFHRVIKNFMIQGGQGKTQAPSIKGEFSANGVQNDLKHVRGVVSMARAKSMDSASSQFFICHGDAAWLDGQYAAFGRVLSGMEAVDRIAVTETDVNDRPIRDQVILRIHFLTEK